MYQILNVPGKTLKLSDVTESAKLLVPGKVTSATFITHGAISMPINPEKLHGNLQFNQVFNNYNK